MFWLLTVELILSDFTYHALPPSPSMSSDVLNHSNKITIPLALKYFDLGNGVSNPLLDFYKHFDETSEDIKQK